MLGRWRPSRTDLHGGPDMAPKPPTFGAPRDTRGAPLSRGRSGGAAAAARPRLGRCPSRTRRRAWRRTLHALGRVANDVARGLGRLVHRLRGPFGRRASGRHGAPREAPDESLGEGHRRLDGTDAGIDRGLGHGPRIGQLDRRLASVRHGDLLRPSIEQLRCQRARCAREPLRMRDALWNAPGTEVAMLSTRSLAVATGIVIVAAWLAASMPRAGAQAPDRLGKVNFPTSCSPAVQAQFERAVALEHSFWFGEAIKGFNAVAQADPSCGIAHWGAAVAWLGNPLAGPPAPRRLSEGSAPGARAKAAGAQTHREQDYIAAIDTFST